MNLVELLTVLSVLAAGYYGGHYLGLEFGIFGWFSGFPLGIVASCGLYWLLRKLFVPEVSFVPNESTPLEPSAPYTPIPKHPKPIDPKRAREP